MSQICKYTGHFLKRTGSRERTSEHCTYHHLLLTWPPCHLQCTAALKNWQLEVTPNLVQLSEPCTLQFAGCLCVCLATTTSLYSIVLSNCMPCCTQTNYFYWTPWICPSWCCICQCACMHVLRGRRGRLYVCLLAVSVYLQYYSKLYRARVHLAEVTISNIITGRRYFCLCSLVSSPDRIAQVLSCLLWEGSRYESSHPILSRLECLQLTEDGSLALQVLVVLSDSTDPSFYMLKEIWCLFQFSELAYAPI